MRSVNIRKFLDTAQKREGERKRKRDGQTEIQTEIDENANFITPL